MFTKSQYINGILFILLISAVVFIGYCRSDRLKKYPCYTIGIVKKNEYSRGNPIIIYKYMVKDKMYKEQNSIIYVDKKLIGKRFLVKFYKKDPSLSEILLYYPISDTSIMAPSEGWKEIPDFLSPR